MDALESISSLLFRTVGRESGDDWMERGISWRAAAAGQVGCGNKPF